MLNDKKTKRHKFPLPDAFAVAPADAMYPTFQWEDCQQTIVLWTKSNLPPIFVSKVLLEYSHTYTFTSMTAFVIQRQSCKA